jgi:hypothetical protein
MMPHRGASVTRALRAPPKASSRSNSCSPGNCGKASSASARLGSAQRGTKGCDSVWPGQCLQWNRRFPASDLQQRQRRRVGARLSVSGMLAHDARARCGPFARRAISDRTAADNAPI